MAKHRQYYCHACDCYHTHGLMPAACPEKSTRITEVVSVSLCGPTLHEITVRVGALRGARTRFIAQAIREKLERQGQRAAG